jgi:hypothetical protein
MLLESLSSTPDSPKDVDIAKQFYSANATEIVDVNDHRPWQLTERNGFAMLGADYVLFDDVQRARLSDVQVSRVVIPVVCTMSQANDSKLLSNLGPPNCAKGSNQAVGHIRDGICQKLFLWHS